MKWIALIGLVLGLTGCDLFGGENNAPEFTTSPDTVATVATQYEYIAHATDEDGDKVDLDLIEAPFWLTVADDRGSELTLRGTPARNHAGAQIVELRASDGEEATFQRYTLRVGYDFAGVYLATSFTYFASACGDTYDALSQGGFFQLTVDPFGRFDAGWEPGLSADPISTTTFSGTYTVSGDVLTLTGIDENLAASIWNDTHFRIEPPRLRQTSTIQCGARLTLEKRR